jgi:hypothetical protein
MQAEANSALQSRVSALLAAPLRREGGSAP